HVVVAPQLAFADEDRAGRERPGLHVAHDLDRVPEREVVQRGRRHQQARRHFFWTEFRAFKAGDHASIWSESLMLAAVDAVESKTAAAAAVFVVRGAHGHAGSHFFWRYLRSAAIWAAMTASSDVALARSRSLLAF